MINLRNVRECLAAVGIGIRFDHDTRQWCVRPFGGCERNAYYTDDLEDAYYSGISLSQSLR